MNNAVFGKTMENVRKNRDIKHVTTESWGNYFKSEPNYHTTKLFTEDLLAKEMTQTEMLLNKHVYLVISILKLSKLVTLMYEFWYDYIKIKYREIARLCFMDRVSLYT